MDLTINVDAFKLMGSMLEEEEEEGCKVQSILEYLECLGVHQPR